VVTSLFVRLDNAIVQEIQDGGDVGTIIPSVTGEDPVGWTRNMIG